MEEDDNPILYPTSHWQQCQTYCIWIVELFVQKEGFQSKARNLLFLGIGAIFFSQRSDIEGASDRIP